MVICGIPIDIVSLSVDSLALGISLYQVSGESVYLGETRKESYMRKIALWVTCVCGVGR